ncbi:prolipoprotein diacylglyceryl transferase [Streptomyces sp. P9(2023)]|uniref:prolipoprotein diacylglyceryl transferase n=1 Tax=Streptomyces sp. P9(2023) TaxID=3064394 RepID=UPI0028F418FF|nr:prolipoprotein diacylglyceryl transferase [Streptomyces sp. P9(2023)]MDT9692983.1 prolipoprotein diacylglyceryl transferase [Streptomyces sp. P9(2023)]
MTLAFLPSPPSPYLNLGPLMLHWYAIMVILGVIAAVAIGQRRWSARGGAAGTVLDVAMVAVPFGILGGRLYHVITSWQLYFGEGRNPVEALYVWQGGLGVWGAIAGGALGAWIAARRRGIDFAAFADAAAPGILVGQAIGRIGCWFNQELYGRPTSLPWGLEIDPANRPAATPDAATYHPTFAYEATWNLGAAALIVWAERRFRLDRGRVFALYVAAYTAGRGWIETLRVDPANHLLGLRLNVWTSLLLFLAAVAFLIWRRGGGPALAAATDDAGVPASGTHVATAAAVGEPGAVPEPSESTVTPSSPRQQKRDPVAESTAATRRTR